MKNIYEDANNRSDMNNVSSGTFDNENNPASQMRSPMQNPANANQPQNIPSPQLQLTQEQVAALLSQLLNAQQPMTQPQPQPAQTEIKTEPKAPQSPLDSGKRILYQSPDFDDVGEKKTAAELPPAYDEKAKLSFYDDDDMFDSEEVSRESLRSAVKPTISSSRIKTTSLGKSFSVDEVEYDNSDLPITIKKADEKTVNAEKSEIQVATADVVEEEINISSKPTFNVSAKIEKSAPKPMADNRKFVPSIEIEEVEIGTPSEKAKKKISTAEIVRRVVLSVSLLAMVVAAAVLVREFVLHKQNQNLESDVKNLIVDVVETTKVKKKDKDKNTNKTTNANATTALTPEQQWAQIRAEYPNVIFPPNIQLKYAKLYATNQDFVGYLSADGANLNLPIVQTNDDEEYMTKNFYGKQTKYGCPFVTHVNKIDKLDMNTIIFGHHMNDGTVFGALDNYKTLEGFKKAPVITFNTLYKDYKWKVIAAFITNAREEEDNGYVFKYYFASLSTTERFSAYLNELAQRSLYDTGVDVLPTDKLLTLSTCSHEFNEARMVVVARLVRPGESTTVDVSKATINANPRYPQAYYTKKKQENPFANASRWEVG